MDNQPSANQQILATLVDHYLRDNNFSETRTTFRNEASFIFKSVMIHEELLVNMLSLDKILDDLVSLNEEKMMMLNERDHQTQKLLLSMKSIMNSYYICVGATLPQTNLPEPPLPPPQPNANSAVFPTGATDFTTTPAGLLVPQSFKTNAMTRNFSTRVIEDQERFLMKRERYQTQLLLYHMQQLISNYGIESLPITNILESPLLPNANYVMAPQPKLGNRTPSGTITLPGTNLLEPPLPPLLPNTNSAVLPTGVTTITTTPVGSLVPQTINTDATIRNVSTPEMSVTNRKRKDINEATDAPSIGKKSRGKPSSSKILVQGQNTLAQSNNVVNKQTIFQCSSETQSIPRNVVPSGSLVQNSSVAKSLFNPPAISIPINLLDPKTSTRTTSCQSDVDISDTECFRVPPCNGEATPNLTKSITVIPPTDIESLPTTNILMSPSLPNAKSFVIPQPKLGNRTPTGVTITTPPAKCLVPPPINTDATAENVSTPMMSVSNLKSKDTKATDASSIGKKSRGRPYSRKNLVQGQSTLLQSNNVVNKLIVSQPSSETQSIDGNFVPGGSQVQDSNVANCLINPPPVSISINSAIPKPPVGISCQSDADISITEFFDVPPCIIEATPSLRKRAIASPPKQSDSIQSISCISPDMLAISDKPLPNEISTYGPNMENDLPELAYLFNDDNDYSREELSFDDDDWRILDDFLKHWEGVNFSDQPTSVHSKDDSSRSSPKCKDDRVISKLLPSTVEKVLSEKDMNIQGPNSLAVMESFKKGTTNLNPKTNHRHNFDKENC